MLAVGGVAWEGQKIRMTRKVLSKIAQPSARKMGENRSFRRSGNPHRNSSLDKNLGENSYGGRTNQDRFSIAGYMQGS